MTSFLKKVVVNKLDMLGINPDEWIPKHFTETEKKRRERTRKNSTPNIVEKVAGNKDTSSNGNYDDDGEENQNASLLSDNYMLTPGVLQMYII